MHFIAYILSGFCLFATAMSLSKNQKWWVRMFDFPFAQTTLISVVALVFYYFTVPFDTTFQHIFFGLTLLNLIYQLYIVLPYTALHPVKAQSSRLPVGKHTVSLLSANVLQYNKDTARLKKLIAVKKPDIISLLETDNYWYEQTEYLKAEYPHYVTVPLDNTYGLLCYSKLEFAKKTVNYLVDKGVPSVDAEVILEDGQHVRLFVVHPPPPSPSENEESAERDGELMLVGKAAKKESRPVIVVGDLNDVAWSHTTRLFQRTADLLDPRIGRGFFNTFHAKYPFFRWPLDHIFHSDHFRVVSLERLSDIGSDHFPIYIQLNYEPQAQTEQDANEANAKDHAEAQEKITYALNKDASDRRFIWA